MTLPPIRREILVDAPPDVAFALFTSKIGDWWPLAELSVFGAGATVAFEDGALIERSPDGQAAEWGQVTSWRPPGEFSMTWHPGRDTLAASQVTVTFRAAGEQTLVVLEHAGWDVFADPAAARAEYEHGWPEVLRLYQVAVAPARDESGEPSAAAPRNPSEVTSHAGDIGSSGTVSAAEAGRVAPESPSENTSRAGDIGSSETVSPTEAERTPASGEASAAAPGNPSGNTSRIANTGPSGNTSPAESERAPVPGGGGGQGADDGEATWVALEHRAGPAASPDVSLFAQPQFRDHIDFLQRMAGQGYLIAAGPLPSEPGAGMAILRLPGAGRLAEATRLATEEDASVVAGFFTVTVRPWQVMLTGPALDG